VAPAKTVYMPATKRDLDKNGRLKDKMIDTCRYGAQKDRVRVVITKTRPNRNPHLPDEHIPVMEISPGWRCDRVRRVQAEAVDG
jgi:hypothetical protein